jgi:hypothetical protein
LASFYPDDQFSLPKYYESIEFICFYGNKVMQHVPLVLIQSKNAETFWSSDIHIMDQLDVIRKKQETEAFKQS